MARIDSLEQLRQIYAQPSGRSVHKQLDRLDRHCRRFIELAPFLVLASADAEGHTDASPRGGPPGFVAVHDDHTLLIPDRPGNNRIDSMTNLIARPEVALIFLIPGVDEALRVAGRVEIRDDAELCQRFAERGRIPKTVLRITVREAFLHCAKALMRSRLWHADAQVERSALPTMGEMLKDQTGLGGKPETQEEMLERYRKVL